MENTSSIKEIISNSLDQVRTIIDADTVVGKEIVTKSGTVIIPISKVSMGFASGGLDLPNKQTQNKNFGGGGGTGVTVSPIGFLIVTPDGRVEMLPMVQEKSGPIEQIAEILDRTPDIIDRVKSVFTSNAGATDAGEAESFYASKLSKNFDADELDLSKKELKQIKKQQKADKKAAKGN